MRTPVKLRSLTTEEVTEIKRLASSRKAPMRLVQRARVIALMLEDPSLYATSAGLKAGFKSSAMGAEWSDASTKTASRDWKTALVRDASPSIRHKCAVP